MVWAVAFCAVHYGGCASVRNYGRHAGPMTQGHYAPDGLEATGTLKVVSFNIKFSRKIDHAIFELSETPELATADLILLQEVDDIGVERMARLLGYDYVYYPASVHTKHDRHFGNAILSRWPVTRSGRLDLPHENPKNDQRRTAVWGDVRVDEHLVRVYSAHTATIWLGHDRRRDQIATLTGHIQSALDEAAVDGVIVAGDFNSLSTADVEATTRAFEEIGLARVSRDVENTARLTWGLRHATLDHVFARGFTLRGSGKADRTRASDHVPVWVFLQFGG